MNGANPFHGINEANCRQALDSLRVLHGAQTLKIRLQKENARLNREREEQYIATLKENAEQWQAIAEKLDEYLHKFCMNTKCDENCPLSNHCTFVYKDHIQLAKKELGYE